VISRHLHRPDCALPSAIACSGLICANAFSNAFGKEHPDDVDEQCTVCGEHGVTIDPTGGLDLDRRQASVLLAARG
jgi:hypothetical protein